jgi:hypothetical protein
MRAHHRTESDGVSVAVGIHLTAYALVFGLFALWLHSQLQPRVFANPGLAAYAPPHSTVISYDMPARLLAEHGQAPPLAEFTARREEPETTGRSIPAAQPEPDHIIHAQRPALPREPAAPPERPSPASRRAAAYPSYSGDRPF